MTKQNKKQLQQRTWKENLYTRQQKKSSNIYLFTYLLVYSLFYYLQVVLIFTPALPVTYGQNKSIQNIQMQRNPETVTTLCNSGTKHLLTSWV